MASAISFSARMDSDLKNGCEELYRELGMTLTTAINVFLRQSLRVSGILFDVKLKRTNEETIAAMLEAEGIAHDPTAKHDPDVEEALQKLKQ